MGIIVKEDGEWDGIQLSHAGCVRLTKRIKKLEHRTYRVTVDIAVDNDAGTIESITLRNAVVIRTSNKKA